MSTRRRRVTKHLTFWLCRADEPKVAPEKAPFDVVLAVTSEEAAVVERVLYANGATRVEIKDAA